MKTKEEFEVICANLTELEMADLLEVCSAIIDRNEWGNLRDQCIGDGDKISDLEEESEKKDEKIWRLEEEIEDYEKEIIKVLSLLENDKVAEAKTKLSQI